MVICSLLPKDLLVEKLLLFKEVRSDNDANSEQ